MDFSVEILKHPTEADWKLCKTCTLVTVGKESSKPPTSFARARTTLLHKPAIFSKGNAINPTPPVKAVIIPHIRITVQRGSITRFVRGETIDI